MSAGRRGRYVAGATLAVLAAVVTVLYFLLGRDGRLPPESARAAATPPSSVSVSGAEAPPVGQAASEQVSQAELARQGSPLAQRLNAADGSAEEDVDVLYNLTRQYVTALQRRAGPPIGDDADLVRVLTGRNPLRLPVIPPGHPAISGDGRLLDRWGTPYHVHAKSALAFEFRSAGPDRRLFTADDVVAGK